MVMATNNIPASFRAVFSLIAVPLMFRSLVTLRRFSGIGDDFASFKRMNLVTQGMILALPTPCLLAKQSCGPGLYQSRAEQQHSARNSPCLIHTHISRFT